MTMVSILYRILFIYLVPLALCQCPTTIRQPCNCATTRYEPISITCNNAASLTVVLQAIGKPTVFMDSLLITNTPIPRLPAFAFQGYSVKRLVLRNNSMTEMDAESFDGPLVGVLEELEIRNNLLTEIPQQGATELRTLITLILAKNNVDNIQEMAFKNYKSKHILRKLDLSSNNIKVVPMNAFDGLASVQEINFDKNQLTVVPTEALSPLTSLEDLSLAVNHVTEIPNGALIFPNLKSLSVEVNEITRVAPEAFQGIPNLLYLYMSANKFQTLNGDMFRYVPNLKVLAMGSNNFTKIPSNAFQFVPGLVRLELAECKIESVEPGAFQTTSKIQVIVLTKNRIQVITRNMFQGLSELYSLDLKGNNISVVEDRAWSKLPSLRHLDISSNKISMLGPLTFAGTFEKSTPPTTRILYIYDNLWMCDDKLDWLRKWLHDNPDLMIDAPGYAPSACYKPQHVFGMQIRASSTTSNDNNVNIVDQHQQQQNNKFTNSPTKYAPPKATKKTDDNNNAHEPLQSLSNDSSSEPKMSGVNIMGLILGIVLGVFLITLILLMITRYFVSKSRRDNKVEDEDLRRFGSTISGYQSATGSVYPSPPLPLSHHPPQMRAQYFLNRPWYWWF